MWEEEGMSTGTGESGGSVDLVKVETCFLAKRFYYLFI